MTYLEEIFGLQGATAAVTGATSGLGAASAIALARAGARVNAVAPCDFSTPMIEPFLHQQEYRDWILDAIPAGRVGQPDEIAGAVLFLASRASTWSPVTTCSWTAAGQ